MWNTVRFGQNQTNIKTAMAIYHLSMKTVSRSAGRSTTAAAAYRAGVKIVDRVTGEVHDYTRKSGVLGAAVVLPEGGTMPRSELWNRVEEHHKRKDAVLAREIVIALPAELNQEDRESLALGYARELADRYSVAVDIALHAPSKEGSDKNWHAHIMLTACHVSPTGQFGKKCVALDPIHCKRHGLPNAADEQRSSWAELANAALARAGQDARIDHRSHAQRGLEELPSYHLGPHVTAILRRGGNSKVVDRVDTFIAQAHADACAELLVARSELRAAHAELERLEAALRQEREAEQKQQIDDELPEQLLSYMRDALYSYSSLKDLDPVEQELMWRAWLKRDPQAAGAWCIAWFEGEDAGPIPAQEQIQKASQVQIELPNDSFDLDR